MKTTGINSDISLSAHTDSTAGLPWYVNVRSGALLVSLSKILWAGWWLSQGTYSFADIRFTLNFICLLAFVLVLTFWKKFTTKRQLVLFSTLILLPEFAFLSEGQAAAAWAYCILLTVLLTVFINFRISTVLLIILTAFYIFNGIEFTRGTRPVPDWNSLDDPYFVCLNVFTQFTCIYFLISVTFHLKNGLLERLSIIENQNRGLLNRRQDLEAVMEELNARVIARNAELQAAKQKLDESQISLLAQNEAFTERNQVLKETYNEIERAQVKVMQSAKLASVGSLTMGIAHELNNPLNFIQGALTVMGRKEVFVNEPQNQKLLNVMKLASGHISRIVNTLNDWGNTSEGFDHPCNLVSILEDCKIMLNAQLNDGMQILIAAPGFDCVVPGNDGKLRQLFINLMHNSIHASGPGSRIEAKFSREPGDFIKVSILDQGEGIPADLLDRITEPFFTTKGRGKGTGLGLYLSKEIVEQHHGSMHFISVPGSGTTVEIRLPVTR